jgi:hypothetical protein
MCAECRARARNINKRGRPCGYGTRHQSHAHMRKCAGWGCHPNPKASPIESQSDPRRAGDSQHSLATVRKKPPGAQRPLSKYTHDYRPLLRTNDVDVLPSQRVFADRQRCRLSTSTNNTLDRLPRPQTPPRPAHTSPLTTSRRQWERGDLATWILHLQLSGSRGTPHIPQWAIIHLHPTASKYHYPSHPARACG